MNKEPGTYLYAGLRARIVSSLLKDEIIELNTRSSLHLTLMYSRIPGRRTPIIHSRPQMGYGSNIISVAYIPHADCTCLILEGSRDLTNRHKYFESLGLCLSYDFEPHITVSQGNTVCKWVALIGECVDLSDEYLQVIIKERKDTPGSMPTSEDKDALYNDLIALRISPIEYMDKMAELGRKSTKGTDDG